MRILLSFIIVLLVLNTAIADEPSELSPRELEEWFQDDERLSPYDKKSDEGTLVFLDPPPEKRTPYSRNILTIPDHAVHSGWVEIDQCHEQLDPVAAVEVVYRYKEMRGLRITRTARIGKAWVEGQSIQLEDVQKEAMFCMQAEARILYKLSDNRFLLRNGPFQRRFLDSYFPLHVALTIRYPVHLLSVTGLTPATKPGFVVKREDGSIHIDSWFEGRLTIEAEFRPVI